MVSRARWVVAAGAVLALTAVLFPGTALAQVTTATVIGTAVGLPASRRPL